MKTRHLCFVMGVILTAVVVLPAHAQWAHTLRSKHGGTGSRVAVDGIGHVYAAGVLLDTLYLDSGDGLDHILVGPSNPYPVETVYLLKYDADGNRVFATKAVEYPGPYDERPFLQFGDLVADEEGNVIVVGSMVRRAGPDVRFGDGPGAQWISQYPDQEEVTYVAKFDPSGVLAWVRLIGPRPGGSAWNVQADIDRAGNIYVAGQPFLTKIGPEGEEHWRVDVSFVEGTAGPPNDVAVGAQQVCAAGSVYLPTDFDPGPGIHEIENQGYVACYGLDGTFRHAAALSTGNPWTAHPQSLVFGGLEDRLHVTALVHGDSLTLDGRVYTPVREHASSEGAVLAIDPTLEEIVWAHAIAQGVESRADVAPSGEVIVAGVLYGGSHFPLEAGSLVFQPGDRPASFVMHFDAGGRLQGGFQLGQQGGTVSIRDVSFDMDGAVYLAGMFANMVDFDPDPGRTAIRYGLGPQDGLLMRTDPSGSVAITVGTEPPAVLPADTPVRLTLYPNPTRGPFHVTLTGVGPGPVTVELFDALGRHLHLLYEGPWRGRTTVEVDGASLPSGPYFIRARGGGFTITRGLSIIR